MSSDPIVQLLQSLPPSAGDYGFLKRAAEEAMLRRRPLEGGPRVVPAGDPLNGYIDHTVLKPEATPADVQRVCREASEYGFAAVCVNPVHLPQVVEALGDGPALPCTVAGFPLGASLPAVKAREASLAARAGAREIDMVLSVGMLKAGRYAAVAEDIEAVVQAARAEGAAVKVILETCLLSDEEKAVACVLAMYAQADFVKTSTGFSHGGATPADITLMRRTVGRAMGVKASGGIRTRESALALVEAGANRIGASASVSFVADDPTTPAAGNLS